MLLVMSCRTWARAVALLLLAGLGLASAHAQTQVSNTATVALPVGADDPDPGNNTSAVLVDVYAVSLAKSASPASNTPVAVGDTITYTFAVTVPAGATTTDPVVITDTLGAGLDFEAVTSAGAFSCNAANPLTCTLPAGTAAGTYPVSYTATVAGDAGASVENNVAGADDCAAGCATSHPVYAQVSLLKSWTDPVGPAEVSLTIGAQSGDVVDAVAGNSVLGGASAPATARAAPGAVVILSEAFTTGDAVNYNQSWQCTVDGGTPVAVTPSGASATFTMPPGTGPVACAVGNVRRSATLTLVKAWVDALAGEAATVTTSGFANEASSGSSTADATGNNSTAGAPVTVYAGESATISEVLSNAGNYLATLACTGNTIPLAGNSLTIDPADTDITCTQTNTRRSVTLTLEKQWVNAAIGEQVEVSATGSFTGTISLDSTADSASEVDAATAQPVYAGETITLAESFADPGNAANYASVLACTGNGTPLSGNILTVGAGDTAITCRYTNTRLQTTLQLNKAWGTGSRVGDQAQLASTAGLQNNTNAFASTASVGAASITVTVYAGEVATLPAETMSGAALADYTVGVACNGGDLSGTDGKAANTLEILPADQGQPIQCTYTNQRNSTTLQLRKTWLNGLPGDTVSLVASGQGTFNSSASGGPTQTDAGPEWDVYSGDVITLDESFSTITSDLYNTTLACTGTGGLVWDAGDPTEGVLTVGPSDGPIVCTFANDRKSTQLFVQKVWSGPSPGATVSIPASSGFTNNSTAFTSTFPTTTTVGPFEVFAFENGQLGAESFTSGSAGDFDSSLSCDGTDTNLSNGLTISIEDADSGGPLTCTYSNTFVPRPSLDVEKSTTVTQVTGPGEVIPYTITITNTGNVPLADVSAVDPLVQNALACTPALPVASLAPGAAVSCTASYTVTQADIDRVGSGDGIDDERVENSVNASGTDPDGNPQSDSDTADTTLPQRDYVVGFTKSATLSDANGSGAGSAGEQVSYTFTVTNNGNTTLQSVTITDPLLPSLSCPPIGPLEPGDSVTVGAAPADVVCTGAVYTITQDDIDTRGGGDQDLDNSATGTAVAPGGGSASADASESLPLDPPVPQLNLDKSADVSSVDGAGDQIVYTFTVTNPGNVTVTGIEVTDPMPGLGPITCAPVAPFDLAPGASATCSATYTVTQNDIDTRPAIGNTATAAGDYDGGPVIDTDSATVDVDTGPGQAELIKTADKTSVSTVGETITYTFTVNNPSAMTLEDVQITDDTVLGAGLACDPIPTLAPTASATFTCTGNVYTVQQSDIDNQGNPVDDSGVIANTATAQAAFLDNGTPTVATDSDSWSVDLPPRAPAMFLTKSSDVPVVSGPGQAITYTFEVRNTGNTTLLDVELGDTWLPAVDCDPIASLAPGQTQAFTCTGNTYTVTQNDIDTGSTDFEPDDGQIDNVATATGTIAGTTTTISNSGRNEVNLPVRGPAIGLVKQADVTSVAEPGTINYSFQVTNSGNVTLDDVTVTDPGIGLACPTTTLAPAAVAVFGGAGQPGVTVVCTGTTRTVTQNDVDTLDNIENSAVAAGTTVTGSTFQATSTLSIPVVKNASLAFGKTADRAAVTAPGDPVLYTITGTNTGNLTLANVRVDDPLVPTLDCTPTLPIAALPPGGTFTCTGTYNVTQADFDTNGGGDGEVENTATALYDGGQTSDSVSVTLPTPVQSLTLDKQAGTPGIDQGLDPAVTDAGDVITYTFVVTNTGNQSLSVLAINDAGLDAAATCDRTTLTANGPDSVATCTGQRTITQAEMDSGSVVNTATASANPPTSSRVTSAPDTATVVLASDAAIQLDKTAGAPTVAQGMLPAVTDAGDTIPYGFLVTNTGNVTLSTVTVNDPALSPSAVSCPPGQLAPGASVTCSNRAYTLTQADIDAGRLTNTATATGNPPSGPAVTGDDSTTTPLADVPGLALVKTASPTVVATLAQTVTYSFQVTNTGNVTIDALVIDETAFSGTGTMSAVTCPVTTLAPTASTTCTATYAVTQPDLDAGQVTNTATASGNEPDGTPVASAPDDAVVTVDENAVLTLAKSATPTSVAAVGDTVTYSFLVTNSGNVTVDNLEIDETAFDGSGTPPPISCPVTTLAPSASTTCTGIYTVVQADLDAGSLNNTAAANGTEPGGAAVASGPDDAVVTVSASRTLTLAKSVSPATVEAVGDTVTYSFEVTNTGNQTLDALAIVETAFSGTGTVSAITCPAMILAPTASTTCTGTYAVTQADLDAGTVTNTANATANAPDGTAVPSNADDAVVTVIEDAELTLTKSVSPTTVAAVGDTVTYSFLVTNTGNVTIDGLAIAETAFSGSGTPPAAVCPATTLTPTAATTCTATYTITQDDLDAGVVNNTATANGTDPGGTAIVSDPDDALVTATQAPALTLDKSTSTPTYDSVGDLIEYSYLVTNNGNVTLAGPITIDDDRIVAPNSVNCPAVPPGGLPPGGTITCTASHIVVQSDIDAGSVVNIATATDGSIVSPPDTETVVATQTPAIVLDKTATVADTNGDGVTGDAGDTITYAFSVQNTGNVVLAPVTVTDPLLPSLSCSIPSLAPGDTASCAVSGNTYVITPADEAAGSVINTALATGDAPGTATDPTDDDTQTTPTQLTPAAITVSKSADPASGTEVGPGDTITYTVTVLVADATLHEPVTVTDTLGTGLTFAAVTSPGAFTCNAASPLVCTLPAGSAPGSYALVYTASVDADASGSVGNSVVPTKPPGTDPDPVCTTCDTEHPVVPSTSVVTKASTPASLVPVNPGSTITFTLTTEINGSVTTEPVTLVDTLEPGLTFVAVSDAGIYACSGTLTCVLPAGTLPGSYSLTYTATVDMDASGELDNTVVPSNPPGGDPEPACASCNTVHPVSRPSVSLEKELTSNDDADGNGEVSVGDTLTYTVTATNTGNVPLANVAIDDPMTTPDAVTCALVQAGGTCTLVATYVVTQADVDAGELLNTAAVTTEAPPGVPVLPPEACPTGSAAPNCTADNLTPIIQRPAIATSKSAVLSVDNATPGKGNIDDVITYSVTATNTGNVTLTGVTVTDTFQGGTATVLACAPSTLAPRQAANCDSYDHVITEAEVHSDEGVLVNTVLAEGDAGLLSGMIQVTASAAAEVEVQNEPAELRLTKVAGSRQVNRGDLVRYTLTVENIGEIDLVDGFVVDTPAPGFTYVDGSIDGDDDDRFVTATGSSPLRVGDLDIAAGNTATITYLMRVGAGVRPGVQINRAIAYDPAYDGPASNEATAEVLLGSDPLLDESLVGGTVFGDRDGDGWQDSAALTGVRVQGGFAPGAYVAGSTTIDRGDGPQAQPDASAPLLRGLDLGRIEGRQSVADTAQAHQVVVSQKLRELSFTGDFVLTSAQGATVRMAADGSSILETSGDAAKGLTAAAPVVERQVARTGDGYQVDYVVRNEGIDERGIPGVRIASVEGLVMETDQFGRYHLVGIDAGQSARGRNFILKLDTATLPPGSEITTENPKLRRITGGVPTRFDFGVALPEQPITGSREVEMEIGAVMFAPGSAQVQARYLPVIDSMVEQLRRHGRGEVVISAGGETEALAMARAGAVRALLDERLDDGLRGAVTLSVRADPDDPASFVAGIGEGGPVLGTLLFDTDQATIQPRFDALLDEVARQLAAGGGQAVAIIGHADRRASREYNAALGLRRAKAVYDALAQRLPPDARARLSVEVEPDPAAPLGPPLDRPAPPAGEGRP